MARDRLTADPAGAAAVIEEYLAELDGRLQGPTAVRRAICDELRDGLLEAESAHRAAGLADGEAAEAAVADFGDPATVAAAFAPELVARHARRVALGLLRSGPLVGLAWGFAAVASGMALGPPGRWPVPGMDLALPVIATAIVMAALAGALAIVATGRPAARRPVGRLAGVASTAATTIAASALACDLALLALLMATAASRPESLAWLPATIAATASVTRLTLAARAARRLFAMRRPVG